MQFLQCLHYPAKSLSQKRFRTGKIDSDKAVTGLSVHRTGIDMHTCIDKNLLQFLGAQAEAAAVAPRKVGSLQAGDGHPRQLRREQITEDAIIGIDISVHGDKPLFRLRVGIGRNQCHDSERVHIAYFIDIDSLVDCFAPVFAARHDVGNLESRDIERLARRAERDGIVLDFRRKARHRGICVAGHDDFTVNLVADDRDIVLEADFCHSAQFLRSPDSAGRVVRIAEYEYGSLLYFRLKIFEINVIGKFIGSISRGLVYHETVIGHDAAVVPDRGEEAVIYRCLDKDFIAGFCQRLYRGGEGRNDACGIDNPVFADVPAVPACKPAAYGFIVGVRDTGVAKDALGGAFLHRFSDAWCSLEVHIGYPHWNYAFLLHVPLYTVGTAADIDLIEIEHMMITKHVNTSKNQLINGWWRTSE